MSAKKNLYERIEYWLFNGEFDVESRLSDDDYDVFKRWKFVNNLMYQRRPVINYRQIVSSVRKCFGVSNRTAETDIFFAKKLFGEAKKINKDWDLPYYIEWLKEVASLSEAAGDFRSVVSALDKAAKYTLLITDANGEGTANVPTNVTINFNLGTGQSKLINIDSFQKMNNTDFGKIIESVNDGSLPIDDMEKMLDRYHGDTENDSN